MKKLIAKLVILILSATFVLSTFAACDWVTTIVDKDMAQVVASVNIDEDKLNDDNVLKRDLIAGYMSYGYQYVSTGSYTTSQAYQLVLDNVINNKVITQLARLSLSSDGSAKYVKTDARGLDNTYVKHLQSYLDEYENANALYLVKSSINSMVNSFVEDDDEDEVKEDETFTARTTPTAKDEHLTEEEELQKDATEYEIKVVAATLKYDEDGAEIDATFQSWLDGTATVTVKALNEYLYAHYEIDFSGDRKQAASKLFDYLATNGLNRQGNKWALLEVDKKSDKDQYFNVANPDVCLNCAYFESLLISRLESAVISKYEDTLTDGIENTELDVDKLWQQYKVEYETQEALYRNDITSYETALGNASDSSFVLYAPFDGKYGYVTNLLIGFTDEQSALLSAYSSKEGVTEDQIVNYRKGLLADLKAYDQRTTWVQSNYGTYDSAKFTFGDDYRVSDLSSVNDFVGTVTAKDPQGTVEEDSSGVKKTVWSYSEVTPDKIGFTSFYDTYVKGLLGDAKYFEADTEADRYGVISNPDKLFDENGVYEKFNDLLFAFSTDTGCLNKEYGYLYSDFTSKDTYVEEFANAAELVVSKGVGAYTIVATDYGYHIIMCTKLVTAPYAISDAGKAAFESDITNKTGLAYNYREVKKDAIISTEINKLVEKKINPYLDEDDDAYAVTLFKKTYSDLITDEE